jgi:quercetin dioxygenase-like cupin family protein
MRRTSQSILLFVAGLASGLAASLALAQAPAQFTVHLLLERTVDALPQPAHLRVHDDRWEPGAATGTHDHPGPAILAVLEGELAEETPQGTTALHAGQVVWRAARQSHNVRNLSDRPARVLAIHFDPPEAH